MMDGDVLEINKTELNEEEEEEEEDEKSSDSLEELSDAERLHSVTAAAHTHVSYSKFLYNEHPKAEPLLFNCVYITLTPPFNFKNNIEVPVTSQKEL